MLTNKGLKNTFIPAKSKIANEKTFFENLYTLLDYMKFDACHLNVSDDNPIEQVIVAIGEKSAIDFDNPDEEYQNEHTVIQMMFVSDIQKEADNSDEMYLFQFFSKLPLEEKISLQKQLNLSRLLMSMNNLLPVGSFGIDINKEIYYRYTIICEKRELNYETIFNALEMIDFFLRKFKGKIYSFLEGKEIIGDLIDNIEKGNILDW